MARTRYIVKAVPAQPVQPGGSFVVASDPPAPFAAVDAQIPAATMTQVRQVSFVARAGGIYRVCWHIRAMPIAANAFANIVVTDQPTIVAPYIVNAYVNLNSTAGYGDSSGSRLWQAPTSGLVTLRLGAHISGHTGQVTLYDANLWVEVADGVGTMLGQPFGTPPIFADAAARDAAWPAPPNGAICVVAETQMVRSDGVWIVDRGVTQRVTCGTPNSFPGTGVFYSVGAFAPTPGRNRWIQVQAHLVWQAAGNATASYFSAQLVNADTAAVLASLLIPQPDVVNTGVYASALEFPPLVVAKGVRLGVSCAWQLPGATLIAGSYLYLFDRGGNAGTVA